MRNHFNGQVYGNKSHTGGRPVDILFDTGSFKNLIRDDVAREIGPVHRFYKPRILKDAASNSFFAIGEIKFWIGFFFENSPDTAEHFFEIKAFVLQSLPEEMIAGAEFLQKYKISIQYDSGKPDQIHYQDRAIVTQLPTKTFATDIKHPQDQEISLHEPLPILKLTVVGADGKINLRCLFTPQSVDTILSSAVADQITTNYDDWSDSPQDLQIAPGIIVTSTKSTIFKVLVNPDHTIVAAYAYLADFDTTDYDVIIGRNLIDQYGIEIIGDQITMKYYKQALYV